MPYNDFLHLWNSGLGSLYCEDNYKEYYVYCIRNDSVNYRNKGIMFAGVVSLCIVLTFFSAYFFLTNPNSTKHDAIFIIGSIVGAIGSAVESFRFFCASQKLKQLDLTGFMGSYVPAQRALQRKSMEWGIKNNIVKKVDEKWILKKINPPNSEKSNTLKDQPVIIFMTSMLFAVLLAIFSIKFIHNTYLVEKLPEGVFRPKHIYVEKDIAYNKKSKIPLTGLLELIYESGKIKRSAHFKDGKPVGQEKAYYESGQLKAEYYYQNGKRNGLAKNYFESGALEAELPYQDGKINGIGKLYYETGEIHVDIPYIDGIGNGIQKEYYVTGQLKEQIQYKNGEKDGVSFQYSFYGDLKREILYSNGKAISGYSYDANSVKTNLTETALKKADSTIQTNHNPTALSSAVEGNQIDVVRNLINDGVDVNFTRSGFMISDLSPLRIASSKGFTEIFNLLIDNGANYKERSISINHDITLPGFLRSTGRRNGGTLLHGVGSVGIAKRLIELGIDPNATDDRGNTPLHSQNVKSDIANYLIEAGANVNAKNKFGETPLHLLLNVETIKLIVENGARIDEKNFRGMPPLHSQLVYFKIAKLLVELGADVNIPGENGQTALHMVRYEVTAQFLIENGGNVNAQDDYGNTPLHTSLHKMEIVKALIKAGANPNIKNNKRRTPLHYAKSPEMIDCLIEGLDPNARDKLGRTPLDRANALKMWLQ